MHRRVLTAETVALGCKKKKKNILKEVLQLILAEHFKHI